MKKKFLSVLCAFFILSLAACNNSVENTKSASSSEAYVNEQEASSASIETESEKAQEGTESEENSEEPDESYVTISNGRVSCMDAPEGWAILENGLEDKITYVQKTEDYETAPLTCPQIQVGCDTVSPESVLESVLFVRDQNEEPYETGEVTVAGIDFLTMTPNLGPAGLYGTINGETVVIYYTKTLDLEDETIQKIIGSIVIAPEE